MTYRYIIYLLLGDGEHGNLLMVSYVFICFPRFLRYIISLVQKKGNRRTDKAVHS